MSTDKDKETPGQEPVEDLKPEEEAEDVKGGQTGNRRTIGASW